MGIYLNPGNDEYKRAINSGIYLVNLKLQMVKLKKYGEHSALNMFDEYSMTNQRELAEFTGFTEEVYTA